MNASFAFNQTIPLDVKTRLIDCKLHTGDHCQRQAHYELMMAMRLKILRRNLQHSHILGTYKRTLPLMTHKLLHNPDKARSLTKGQWSVRYIYIIRILPFNRQCKHSTNFQNIQYFNHKNIRFILQAGHILSTVLVYHLVALMRLSMSFSSVRRIYSHQLLSLLLVLHHLLDGSWVTDLLNFGVSALPFCLLCLCF